MEDLNTEKPANTKRHQLIKYILASIAVLICIGFVVAILVVVIMHYTSSPVTEDGQDVITTAIPASSAAGTDAASSTTIPADNGDITAMDIYAYYPEANRDGMKINFYHAANSEEDLAMALKGNITDAIEGDVSVKFYGSPSQTDEAVMNNPPEQISDVTLEEWLEAVIPSRRVIKLDLKIDEVVSIALESLRSRSLTIQQPVWINAEVLEGPNSRGSPLNVDDFLRQLNAIFPHVTVSLGWENSIDYGDTTPYTWEMIDQMVKIAERVSQRVTILGRAPLVRDSWDKFLWLLEEYEAFSLTVYDQPVDIIQPEDVVFVRDNSEFSRVFYDVTNDTKQEVLNIIESPNRLKTFYSGGNVLEYLRAPHREAIQITWAHRVVGREELNSILQDDSILMLETDIQLYGAGTPLENSSLPVMAHDPPALNYELTFEEWMQAVIKSNKTKGIKLDFKSIEAMEAALPILNNLKASLRFPVWINSDVMRGPNSVTQPRNATLFFSFIQEKFPDVTLSPGWTTTYRPSGNNEGYSQQMVEEMYEACSSMRQAITFPVRASLAQRSIDQFKWLLSKSNRYSLTIWHSTSEIVLISDLLEVYNSFSPSKVYFDIPDEMMKELQEAIANSS